MGGGSKSSPPPPPARTKPASGTYAAPPDHDPIYEQLGIEPPESKGLLDSPAKPKRTPLLG